MRPKSPKPTTERTASFGWSSRSAEASESRWMNARTRGKLALPGVQPPWTFMANLDITSGPSMQRVAQYLYYKLHHDSQEDLISMLELAECEGREVQRMYYESQGSELLREMLKWFGAFHDHAERRVLMNAATLSRAVTIYVREPRKYMEGYKHAAVLWEKVLEGLDPYEKKKKRKTAAKPRQAKVVAPPPAPTHGRNTRAAKIATCRIIEEESEDGEESTFSDGEIYEEPEEYNVLDHEYDENQDADLEEEDEESDEESNFTAGALDSDPIEVDSMPMLSSNALLETKTRKRRFSVVEVSSSEFDIKEEEPALLALTNLPMKPTSRKTTMSTPRIALPMSMRPPPSGTSDLTPFVDSMALRSQKSTPKAVPTMLSAKRTPRTTPQPLPKPTQPSVKQTPRLAHKTLPAPAKTPSPAPTMSTPPAEGKGKGRGRAAAKTSMPPPPRPATPPTRGRKRKKSESSSSSPEVVYKNVYEEDVLPKPFRTTRGGKEFGGF